MNMLSEEFNVFDLFASGWPLVCAGTPDNYNACTIGWGSMGTLWTRPGKQGRVVTVYLHPARYTQKLLLENDIFTVNFFSEEYKPALSYMGSHSGRNEDKAAACGLTPTAVTGSVAFREADCVLVCRKLYAHQFAREDIADDVRDYYLSKPTVYPPNENGEWQPHWQFIGEIIEVIEK